LIILPPGSLIEYFLKLKRKGIISKPIRFYRKSAKRFFRIPINYRVD